MSLRLDDSIAAIASPPGGAMRGIVRLSGPQVAACLAKLFRPSRLVELAAVGRPSVLPGGLLLPPPVGTLSCDLYYWPGTRSYTRQPVAELHTLGSPPLLEAVLAAACGAGARLAGPGEFTLRAFLAGRIDLTQAEAVIGVIDATHRRQFQGALEQLAGGLARPLARLRDRLLDLLAHLEAGLDFVEEDIEFIAPAELARQLDDAARQVDALAQQMTARQVDATEPRVVLAGATNVGKSSLLNALAGNEAALVSDRPGTTRDYVCRRVDADGLSCLVVDTAGLGDAPADGNIDHAAQQTSREQRLGAQLVLACIDGSRPLAPAESGYLGSRDDSTRDCPEKLVVLTKCDLPRRAETAIAAVETSSRTGAGLAELRRAIRRRLEAAAGEGSIVAGTASRCRESLAQAAQALARACAAARESPGEELVAADVRLALDEIGQVVGAVYTEDVLDRIFSRFCIGK
jgi:tRNA modification GTPase